MEQKETSPSEMVDTSSVISGMRLQESSHRTQNYRRYVAFDGYFIMCIGHGNASRNKHRGF